VGRWEAQEGGLTLGLPRDSSFRTWDRGDSWSPCLGRGRVHLLAAAFLYYNPPQIGGTFGFPKEPRRRCVAKAPSTWYAVIPVGRGVGDLPALWVSTSDQVELVPTPPTTVTGPRTKAARFAYALSRPMLGAVEGVISDLSGKGRYDRPRPRCFARSVAQWMRPASCPGAGVVPRLPFAGWEFPT